MAIAGSDCMQYFAGKRIGKTKIVPQISPNKSLEGYIAAIVGCNLIHIWLLPHFPSISNLIFVNGLLLAGILGDLFISWWKRNHHIKDTSHFLTGHGGFLDRFSFISPILFSFLFFSFFLSFSFFLFILIITFLFHRLDSHLGAWIWSYLFAALTASLPNLDNNFTQMDYSKIEYLIIAAWVAVWVRFFYCAIFKNELI